MITKHRTGSLLKRGSNYYVRLMVEGKVIVRALRDEAGNPITKKPEAELAREKFVAPYALSTQTEVLQSIAAKLADNKAQLAKIQDEQNPPLTVAQTWTAFRESAARPDCGSETLYQYECQWTAFADWLKEKHPEIVALRGVTLDIAKEYAGYLNHGRFSANTYNKHLGLLSLVFQVVNDEARLTENPWRHPKRGGKIARKQAVTQSRRELTVDELRRVCQGATGELRVMLALGVYSGLRLGDCATLRWCEVDMTRGIITRIPNKTARKPGPGGQPKTVTIPIHHALRGILGEIPVEGRGEYVLPETAKLYQSRIDAVTDKVQAHFKACGIKVWKPDTGPKSKDGGRAVIEVGFHSLRHSFVSLCRASNVPLSVVEALVAHSNPAMTRHYTHTGELAVENAIAALPAVIGDVKPEPPKPDTAAMLASAIGIAKSLTAKNWRKKKAELLALLASGQSAAKK